MAPVARAMCDRHVVHEPLQDASSVAGHVADLDLVVRGLDRPVIIGSSWGAMLALAYAAAHPARVGALFLVGCGTFDEYARARLCATRAERLEGAVPKTFEEWGRATLRTDSFDLVSIDLEIERIDVSGGEASWNDMVRLQDDGTYPAAFAAVESPVLLVHGDYDPHPGALVRDSLRPFIPQLEYAEIPRCGHYPWLERYGRAPFFKLLREWVDKVQK